MAEYTGCDDCRHSSKDMREFPCTVCVHNAIDKFEPMTNADRIRSMSDEELASFLANYEQQDIGNEWCLKLCPKREEKRASGVDCDCQYENYETALAWLKSEVKE